MEEKMARICWNSNKWKKPSGKTGKSKDKTSYEYKHGFGHEEWLFDMSKIIDGYHYSFLQAISNHKKHKGNQYNILLYTYRSDEKKWYWAGQINNIIVLSNNEAERIYTIYKNNGWLDKMKNELMSVNATSNELNKYNIFNIKFRKEDIVLNELSLFNEDEEISTNRVVLLPIEQRLFKKTAIIEITGNNGTDNIHKEIIKRTSKEMEKEIESKHNKIQNKFYSYLKNQFPNDNITMEERIKGLNCMIDIFQEKSSGVKIIYEIKSYDSLKYSIRIAIGQLLEYGYFPNRKDEYKLIVVSNKVIDRNIKLYVENLKEMFCLDIGIINFDQNKKCIIGKYNCGVCNFVNLSEK